MWLTDHKGSLYSLRMSHSHIRIMPRQAGIQTSTDTLAWQQQDATTIRDIEEGEDWVGEVGDQEQVVK